MKMKTTGIVLLGISALSFPLMILFHEAPGDFFFFTFMGGMLGGILLLIIYYAKTQSGPLVFGKILEIKRSFQGSKLTVQFETIDGQQMTASGKTTLTQNDHTAWFQPGMPIPLRYHPWNPRLFVVAIDASLEDLDRVGTEYRKKMQNGPFVFGTLVSMKLTDVQMENGFLAELILRFNTVEGQQVTVSHKTVVLEQFPPETVFPLRYNPKNPEQIFIGIESKDVDEETVRHAFETYMNANGLGNTREEADIMEHGVKAAGVILSAQPTGNTVDGREEMTLHVKVTRPENGGTYDAVTKKQIHTRGLALVHPGSVVDVYYMPENEGNIIVDNKIKMSFAWSPF